MQINCQSSSMSSYPLRSLSKQSKRDLSSRSCYSDIYIDIARKMICEGFKPCQSKVQKIIFFRLTFMRNRSLQFINFFQYVIRKLVSCFCFYVILFQAYVNKLNYRYLSEQKYSLFTSSKLMQIPKKANQKIYISTNGLKQILSRQIDPRYPQRGINWTDDFKSQLPIRIGQSGTESLQPQTLIDMFYRCVKENSKLPALSVKRNNKWETLTYEQYAQQCEIFGRALIAFGVQEYTSLNIIGFNSPEWHITFFGSIFARCLPTGVYTTNSVRSCEYLVQHSECKIVVAQTLEHAQKYQSLIEKGIIKLVIIYNDPKCKIPKKYERVMYHWNVFMIEGHRVELKYLQERMEKVRPGNCCTLVYTSGTTGMPKGVMISHDNYTWTKKAMNNIYERQAKKQQMRMVSFLPLSHVAAQFSDIVSPLDEGSHIYFADPSALQGSLIQTLQEVKPTVFFSVPRVWEKIYDKMQEIANSNGALKTSLANWAKELGTEGTIKEYLHEDPGLCYKLAKTLVFNNVKKALGLDKCEFFLYGAAPMDPKIRSYFLSLNILLVNSYGMSESTGPQNFTDIYSFKPKNMQSFKQVGKKLPGTEEKIVPMQTQESKQNKKSNPIGQICYRGRNTFMGYFKNPEETSHAIDSEGFLHSGDMGRIDKDGILYITGRVKELIITAGGENIPPLLIEQEVMSHLPFVSQVMLVGQRRKFLTCLIAIKESAPGSGKIQSTAKHYLGLKGAQILTIQQARKSKIVNNLIQSGLKLANEKSISRAQNIQDYFIIPEEFSVQNGLLTPTMKLKRKQAQKKYFKQIEQMYMKPKL